MIQIGSKVRIKAPFAEAFPGEQEIIGLSETGAWQIGSLESPIDFDEIFLEEVE